MIDGKFDVVFRGQVVKNFELDTVKENLVKLFKSSPEAIDKLFSGEETPIRKNLSYAEAMKYQTALKNAGALALIKELTEEDTTPKAPPEPRERATFSSPDDEPQADTQTETAEEVSETATSTPETPQTQEEPADGSMTLAEAGAQILPDKVYEKRDVDTSDLSLANAGERILPPKAPENHPQPNIDHLSIKE